MSLSSAISRRLSEAYWCGHDAVRTWQLAGRSRAWPCTKRQYLVVGCESSGTTPISGLLLNNGYMRFLVEGKQRWVWKAYMDIFQGQAQVRDFPRLQLFDGVKVPGFAAILDKYVAEFPNSTIVYVVRDPRDVICSAFRTWKVKTRDELRNIPWVKQTWLGIETDDPIERLALRWRKYVEVSQTVPGVLYLKYEDFCSDKIGTITDVARRLNIPIDADRVTRMSDVQASHESVRDYAPAGVATWRDSKVIDSRDLELIEKACGTWMKHWGYL